MIVLPRKVRRHSTGAQAALSLCQQLIPLGTTCIETGVDQFARNVRLSRLYSGFTQVSAVLLSGVDPSTSKLQTFFICGHTFFFLFILFFGFFTLSNRRLK